MGKFQLEPYWHYEDGEITAIHGLEYDKWGWFEMLDNVAELGPYVKGKFNIWWRTTADVLKQHFREINGDSEAMNVATYAINNKCEVHVFVEHTVDVVDVLVDAPPLPAPPTDPDVETKRESC